MLSEDKVMNEKQDRDGSDKPTKIGSSEAQSDAASEEARQSASDLVKRQRSEMQLQKDPDRPSMFTSHKFGRVELVGDHGEKLVKGVVAANKDSVAEPQSVK